MLMFVLCVSVLLQFPNRSLLLAACAACIGGTFQYGYNISVINAPTMVKTQLSVTGPVIIMIMDVKRDRKDTLEHSGILSV